ncbi:MAG: patatin-like phospholipase family protein [Desulfatitalea sp.]|nr:patatin-like phospholipase family protein [Desulfatitalea sp.]NNK02909.1 patatin-like phospholipase family protein [Desulfatitalea sp.]
MAKEKIGIACQGGGSQTAFTAGVLSALLRNKVHETKQIVSLSGTSGGAVCATLAWYALLKAAKKDSTPIEQGLVSFWQDNSTKNLVETFLNDSLIQYIQLVDNGFLPEWKSSPYSAYRQTMAATLQWIMPQFYDFKGLLEKHIDFDELPRLIDRTKSPVLILGAADVVNGKFEKFNSHDDGIQVEKILASAAVPSIMQAVQVGDNAYWDGLFSDNPPTDELVDDKLVGKHRLPDQLWVIQINPKQRDDVPRSSEDIIDRRNEMIGNESLYQDLRHICLVNKLLERKAIHAAYIQEHNLKQVEIFIIQMSKPLQQKLDYASKLDRNHRFIEHLFSDGIQQGEAFLQAPDTMRFDPATL